MMVRRKRGERRYELGRDGMDGMEWVLINGFIT